MERRDFINKVGKSILGITSYSLLGNTIKFNETGEKWNFVFILADDMGWNQVGYGGSKFYETPNIDKIAKEGIYFTQAYSAAPTCSPSRAGIMTGKAPARVHITEYIPGDDYPWAKLRAPKMAERLELQEVTLAELLKGEGYTSAMIGKWHLNKDKNYQPGRLGDAESQGFDYVHATVKPESDADPNKDAHHAIELTNEAINFLDQNKENPFFLYIAHHIVHRPIMENPGLIYKYQEKEDSDKLINNPIMGAMIERLDLEIGRILKKIDELNLKDNTIIVFMSDNGGYDKLQSQDPLRGGKSMLYEGGIRVPLAIRWPGVIKPGSQSRQKVIGMDFFPTFAEIAGIKKLPQDIDGVSIVPTLKKSDETERTLYWHYPHYHRFGYMPSGAIIEGKYKLIEWYEKSLLGKDKPYSLFNLETDISEEKDLSEELTDIAEKMWIKLKNWRKNVDAQEMTINQNYDQEKALFWRDTVDPNDAASIGQYY